VFNKKNVLLKNSGNTEISTVLRVYSIFVYEHVRDLSVHTYADIDLSRVAIVMLPHNKAVFYCCFTVLGCSRISNETLLLDAGGTIYAKIMCCLLGCHCAWLLSVGCICFFEMVSRTHCTDELF